MREKEFALRRYGSGGVEQILKRELFDIPLNESLPIAFYSDFVKEMEEKEKLLLETISSLEIEFSRKQKALQREEFSSGGVASAQRIFSVIRNQQEAIDRIGKLVILNHSNVLNMREKFLQIKRLDASVFEEEDRLLALQQKRKEVQLKEALRASQSSSSSAPSNGQLPPQQQQAPSTSNPFSFPQNSSTAPSSSAFGGGLLGGAANTTSNWGSFGTNSTATNAFSSSSTSAQPTVTWGQLPSSSASTSTPSAFGSFGALGSGGTLGAGGGTESVVQAKMNRKKNSLASSRKF